MEKRPMKAKNLVVVLIQADCPKCGESLTDDNGSFDIYVGDIVVGHSVVKECFNCKTKVSVYTRKN